MNCWTEAFQGAQAADALAMPVHWYYDRAALRADYGLVDRYMAPKTPHPGSILWRSSYQPPNERGDILREQAQYWGQRGDYDPHAWLSGTKADAWCRLDDGKVIGERFSPACYIAEAMPASLYLAWKYHDDFDAGITADAMVGGDNCHRGAVVGSLLGAANGVPAKWLENKVA
jgi:ADP-ribosylglycohydrolase